jgi:hypothetical protein
LLVIVMVEPILVMFESPERSASLGFDDTVKELDMEVKLERPRLESCEFAMTDSDPMLLRFEKPSTLAS